MTQTINFVLHISQALVGRAQLSVFHLKYSILVFELIEGLQAGTHGCDLLLYPRTAGQKWRQQLVHARLELLRRLRPEAEKIPQNSAKDQQRDNTCTAHVDSGLQIARLDLIEIEISGRTEVNPQSEIVNP